VIFESSFDHDCSELLIRVRDSGIGMSQQTMDSLFERFTQAQDGSTKGFQGTGLGLAITRQLVELADGEINVESELGEGSTFTVRMPVQVDQARAEAALSGQAVAKRAELEPEKIDLAGIRVLCVDDSEINLMVVTNALTKAGARVTKALSAGQALELVESDSFDLVLTDISMPEMDGEELQSRLADRYPDLPVIAVTGNVLEEDSARFYSEGFVAVLSKPVGAEILVRTVRDQTRIKESA